MGPPAHGQGGRPSILAGSLAGMSASVFARLCIAPVERVKIQVQISATTLRPVLRQILQEEGPRGFWRGVGASVTRVAPYMGVKFIAVEQYKAALRSGGLGDVWNSPTGVTASSFVAGSGAGMTAVVMTYPFDVLRARMAVVGGERPPSYAALARTVVQHNGFKGLYRGLGVTVKGICVHDGCKFGTYDYCKRAIETWYGVQANDIPFLGRVLSGAFAGLIAQTIAYPTDVLRRRLQTSDGAPKYTGIIQGVREIYRTEGLTRGVFRGWGINLFKALPNIAIYLSLYDVLLIRLQRLGL